MLPIIPMKTRRPMTEDEFYALGSGARYHLMAKMLPRIMAGLRLKFAAHKAASPPWRIDRDPGPL
ncbi:hypothetical protein [Paracoccus methylarcula]|uniref:Uncharacterized protein n=1 Tax=Paracoccus methylarcula TaxID=72022 RepID=A0A3R7LN80_9RHOB|nr:hypothetical protein [Paracoccus methylarcula]RNF33145.1 hypothetical protein A7A09_018420 [Paracoccus methylarcula]